MKICPVCNESFPEELRFCDLDGAKLTREGVAEGQDQNRLSSLIGVGILFGAVVIIAISVLFSPRTPDAANFTPSTPPSQTSADSVPAPSVVEVPEPEIVVAENVPAEPKKKEKPADSANGNSNSANLDPKAAAGDTDPAAEAAKGGLDIEHSKPTDVEPGKPDSGSTAKAKDESNTTAVKPAPEAKTDKKVSKDPAKNADGKKPEEKKEGKLRKFFKKIFGKD
jgi:hypothetical protein